MCYRANLSPDGQWIETETSIKPKALPKLISVQLEKEYKGFKIVEIEEVDHYSKGRFYDVEFKKDGEKKDMELSLEVTVIN